ncbi:MAG: hypothetical protein ACKOAX_04090, partial [Candidatus Kapaibacterium sp.]
MNVNCTNGLAVAVAARSEGVVEVLVEVLVVVIDFVLDFEFGDFDVADIAVLIDCADGGLSLRGWTCSVMRFVDAAPGDVPTAGSALFVLLVVRDSDSDGVDVDDDGDG